MLGLATFASVRSANRAARVAERALLAGLRPVLVASNREDPEQKIMWHDRHFAHVPGGLAVIETDGDVMYLAISVRNVGAGMAVLHGWYPWGDWRSADDPVDDLSRFRRLTRDLYVPPGGIGF